MGNTFTIQKDKFWKLLTFILIGILILGSIFVFVLNLNEEENNGNNGQGDPTKADVDDDAILGNKNASVTIIEFSDYQCSFCRTFWTDTLPSIRKDYIDTGKARFVYRDFPLTNIHPGALPAAEAAECVRDSGKDEDYFKMHDKIFEEQNKLGNGTVEFGADELKRWASEIGYNISSCLDSGKFRNEVQKDFDDAIAAGGTGTPYFVINGRAVEGAQPYSVFKAVIDDELSG